MFKPLAKCLFGLIALSAAAGLSAEKISKFYFTGETRTERVIITHDDKKDTLQYLTPAKNYNFVISSYDYVEDENYGNTTFRCTADDTMFGRSYDVLLTYNDNFADIRFGTPTGIWKRLTFVNVPECEVVK
ncbi:MAG: hypothetical protein II811_05530 [Spirochaetaceae bacterium]|nr:hypothetical protein [Spirochaetaceae bacterium]